MRRERKRHQRPFIHSRGALAKTLRAHFDSPLADAVVVAGGDAGAGATCVGSSADKVEQGKRGESDVIRQLRWLLRHV